MALEVELKLALSPRARQRLMVHPALVAAGEPTVRLLDNIYFDTPDLRLWQRRIALRLRRIGERWVQTLKTAEEAAGGLASRREWETPSDGKTLDFSGVDDPALRRWLELPAIVQHLQPAFQTTFTRRAWHINTPDGARIELALDHGTLRGGGRSAPLCEVELELLSGTPAALYRLAQSLSESATLRPVQASKAERGYRLFRHASPEPVKVRLPELHEDSSPGMALRTLAQACLSAWLANEEGVLCAEDAEFIHQARVSLRRLRSARRLFRAHLPEAFHARFGPALSRFARRLGEARDWDVFCTETLPMLAGAAATDVAPAVACAQDKQQDVRARLLRHLRRPSHARLLLDLSAALDALPPNGGKPDSLRPFAARRLLRCHQAVLASCPPDLSAATVDAPALHRTRIQLKRLRYALDLFTPLYKRKRVLAYIDRLTGLQDALGAWNDLYVAERLLADLANTHPEAATIVTALEPVRARLARQRLPDLTRNIEAFRRCPAPWKPS